MATGFNCFSNSSILLVLSLSFLPGCSSTTWEGKATITSSSGEVLCAKHKIPLISKPGHRLPPDAKASPEIDWIRRFEQNPNAIGINEGFERSNKDDIPATITYCPKCERAVSRE
jgi:hypothetical protein